MGIKPARWVGVPALRAAGVEQKIVKVPNNKSVVTLGRPQPIAAGGVDLEKDLAVDQQGEKLEPREAALATEPVDGLRRGQCGQGGCDLRIANLEQRAGAR
jgi:hypothetical protein